MKSDIGQVRWKLSGEGSPTSKRKVRPTKAAITWLTPYGKEILTTQKNLLKALGTFDQRLVVDNHVPVMRISALPQNTNTAFIIGTTVDKECASLKALVEDRDRTPKVRENVFLFGYASPRPGQVAEGYLSPYLVLAKLNGYFNDELDMDGLRDFSAVPKIRIPWDTWRSIQEEKSKILQLLGVSDIQELPGVSNPKDEQLRSFIERERPKAYSDFWKSNDIARHAYARMLIRSDEARKEFQEPLYPNVFGDVHLVQNALFLNAAIISDDHLVHTLAELCSVEYRPVQANASPRSTGFSRQNSKV